MSGTHLAWGNAMPVEHIGDAVVCQKNILSKKRAASDTDSGNAGLNLDYVHEDPINGAQIDDGIDEPTMGDQSASLVTLNDDEGRSHEQAEASLPRKPPSADSVHVLLKQALHADDRSLLLDCLFRQDEKIIANSVSLLKPSNVLKLLESLISMIQSRGAVLVCALPWLKSLLLQHSSSIMCEESSLIALNSLYQSSMKALFRTPTTTRTSNTKNAPEDADSFAFPEDRGDEDVGLMGTATHDFGPQWESEQLEVFNDQAPGTATRSPGLGEDPQHEVYGVSNFEDFSHRYFDDEVGGSSDMSAKNNHSEFKGDQVDQIKQNDLSKEVAGTRYNDAKNPKFVKPKRVLGI